ncbi:MAG: hypothetical protein R8G66_00050 [Cytophagales bacterium]|nr:hypothetical protein [Cytophagales bacterium]
MKKIFLGVLLIFLAFQMACLNDDGADVGEIVFVVDNRQGPLSDALVTIYGSENDALNRQNVIKSGRTDDTGEVVFEFEAGEYHYVVELTGSNLNSQIGSFTVIADQEGFVDVLLRENTNVSTTASSTNGKITIVWEFLGEIVFLDGTTEPWSETSQAPYLEYANKWLDVLTAIEGTESHTITIELTVNRFDDGNGAAGPLEQTEIDGFSFPVRGDMIISNHTYEQGFDPVEFEANILHEMGHIFGFGYSNLSRTTSQESTGGMAYQETNSQAVVMYNEIYGVNFSFIPFSDDQSHLFDPVLGDDQPRNLPDGTMIPPLTKELMANGNALGKVTAGLLDVLGYEVDYSKTDEYTP